MSNYNEDARRMGRRILPPVPQRPPSASKEDLIDLEQRVDDDLEALHARMAVNELALEALADSHSRLLDALFTEEGEGEGERAVELEPGEPEIPEDAYGVPTTARDALEQDPDQDIGHPQGRPDPEALAEQANSTTEEDYDRG